MSTMIPFSSPDGQGWQQICQLILAVGLSALIGIERQLRQKAAGLRTNTLVGTGSALFTLVSKYGFMDILSAQRIELDPSRIAAQIVSGIGFIGGGIIFKQQSDVRGLTTAAAVWLTSAVGTACGAGLPILASVATALYFVTVVLFPLLWIFGRKIRHSDAATYVGMTIRYRSLDSGLEPILEAVLKAGAETVRVRRIDEIMTSAFQSPAMDATVERQSTTPQSGPKESLPAPAIPGGRTFDVQILVIGHKSPNEVASILSQLRSVVGVAIDDGPIDEV